MENRIIKIASEIFNENVEQINIQSSNKEIKNWDSLGHINLILSIEEEFQITFTHDQITKINKLKDILEIIEDEK